MPQFRAGWARGHRMDSSKFWLRARACRLPNLIRAASAAFATGLLLAAAPSALAASLLGGTASAPVPSTAQVAGPSAGALSLPGAGSLLPGTSSVTLPATSALPGIGSTLPVDTGALPAPSLSVPVLPSAPSPLTTPLATLPSSGPDLPVGLSPDLKDLSKNIQQQLRGSGNAGRPLRNGFVVPAPEERRFVSNEVVLHMPTLPGRTLYAIARRHHLTLVGSRALALTGHTLYRWRIDDGRRVGDVIRDLAAEQRISAAQPNFTFTLQDAGSEQGDPAQYAIAKMHVPEAHQLANGDHVLVAVIDSGIDRSHPELAGAIAASYDAVTGDDRPDAHGTAMAGAIAAHAKLMGVAPQVRLLAIRAFGPGAAPEGTTFAILAGLDWAIQQGARVVNMSFAGPRDPALAEAIAKARKRGVVFIAAAGNAGPKSPPLYPGADPNVIAVTATDKDDRLFAKANRGTYIAVAAPGVDILTPAPHASMQLSTGTSVAAAHVSGIVALLIERKPSLRPEDVRKLLLSTARHLGDTPRDDAYGAGRADALAAVSALEPKTAAKK